MTLPILAAHCARPTFGSSDTWSPVDVTTAEGQLQLSMLPHILVKWPHA